MKLMKFNPHKRQDFFSCFHVLYNLSSFEQCKKMGHNQNILAFYN